MRSRGKRFLFFTVPPFFSAFCHHILGALDAVSSMITGEPPMVELGPASSDDVSISVSSSLLSDSEDLSSLLAARFPVSETC